jgi:hypothetical protein
MGASKNYVLLSKSHGVLFFSVAFWLLWRLLAIVCSYIARYAPLNAD